MADPNQNEDNIFGTIYSPLNCGFNISSPTPFEDELYPNYQYYQYSAEDYCCYDDGFINSMPLFQHSFLPTPPNNLVNTIPSDPNSIQSSQNYNGGKLSEPNPIQSLDEATPPPPIVHPPPSSLPPLPNHGHDEPKSSIQFFEDTPPAIVHPPPSPLPSLPNCGDNQPKSSIQFFEDTPPPAIVHPLPSPLPLLPNRGDIEPKSSIQFFEDTPPPTIVHPPPSPLPPLPSGDDEPKSSIQFFEDTLPPTTITIVHPPHSPLPPLPNCGDDEPKSSSIQFFEDTLPPAIVHQPPSPNSIQCYENAHFVLVPPPSEPNPMKIPMVVNDQAAAIEEEVAPTTHNNAASVFDPLREIMFIPPPPPLFPIFMIGESSHCNEPIFFPNNCSNNNYHHSEIDNNPLAMIVANSSSSYNPMVAAPIPSHTETETRTEEHVAVNNNMMLMSKSKVDNHNKSSNKRKKNIIPLRSDFGDYSVAFRQGVPIVSQYDLLQKFETLAGTKWGTNLRHMIIRVRCNEDVMALLTSIAKEKKSLLILGTVGTLSVVEFLQQGGKPVTFQGKFIIISLAGIILFDGDTQIKSEMYVSIGGADGQVFGGPVNGRLLVSTPLQMIGLTFVDGPNPTKKPCIPKMKNKVKKKGGRTQEKGKNKVAEKGGGGGGSIIIKELNENKKVEKSKGEEGSSNINEVSLAEFFDAELELAPHNKDDDPYGDLEMLDFFHDLMK